MFYGQVFLTHPVVNGHPIRDWFSPGFCNWPGQWFLLLVHFAHFALAVAPVVRLGFLGDDGL